MINIDIHGIDQLNRSIRQLGPLFTRTARAVVVDTMLFAEMAIADHIDRYDAIDTGRLKGSITQRNELGDDGKSYTFDPKDTAADLQEIEGPDGIDHIRGVVGTNVHYAIPVHEGYTTSTGRHIEGRPYMADAMPEIRDNFERTARDTFGGLLR